MAVWKHGGIYSKKLEDGEAVTLDLVKDIRCTGFIAGEAAAGTLNLKASNDGVNWFGSQDITTHAPYTAVQGPFKYLEATATGGTCYLRIQ